MIHDIILSCLSLTRKGFGISRFLASNAVEHFIHPCEREIFLEILEILGYLQEVVQFAQSYGGADGHRIHNKTSNDFMPGFYLTNFAKGVEAALEDYYNEIIKLEMMCVAKPTNSLVHVYDTLQLQLPIALFLRKLIRDAQIRKLHGCALLQNLHKQSQHGDIRLERILTKVVRPVKMAFLSHLTNWLLFGKIDDVHSEFFIKFTPHHENSIAGTIEETQDPQLVNGSSEDYIWQYEINMQQLPGFLSTICAEKILFIGQTVLIFQMDRNTVSKNRNDLWTMTFLGESQRDDIWDGKDSDFFRMIDDLNKDDKIDDFRFESVINEIKKYVSTRLSEIAVNEVDLEHQMSLIKDFYLLGRGEFYLEFLRQLYGALASNGDSEMNTRNYTRSFELAANVMGITDDLEHFSLGVQKQSIDPDESYEFGILQNLHLKYIYKWPLNLLFSPKAIERYNKVFRFLLVVRKLQYDMHLVWANHTWASKTLKDPVNTKIMNLRNHLMFFLDNMQYYIQADVLESQFCILMDVIKNKADFEEIQRAHSIFLANVLSQCFLLSEENETSKMNITESICTTQNPILGNILEIFTICEKFSCLTTMEITAEAALEEADRLEGRFDALIASLIKLLVEIKLASSLGPLSQLLLRLDYNHWFSANKSNVM